MTRLTVAGGSGMKLGALLARAGEGSILEVIGRPDLVVKVLHPTLTHLADKLEKVAAMVNCPPAGAVQADGFVVLTWPQQVVFEEDRPVGYTMPRIDTAAAVELHTISNPFNRANPLPGTPQWTAHADWAHLLNVAANLCLAVDVVHRVDAVIGDFQERNIFVADTTRVTLVDCDSMQFTDAQGRQYLCEVGRPEFTAPELATLNLRTQARDKPSDLFPLAVHIYQLLLGGNHPFMRGAWTGNCDQLSALSLAQAGHWAGGPGSPLTTHPLAPPLSFLPAQIGALFTRAFTDGAVAPTRRPTAAEWRQALLGITTTTCAEGTHRVPTTTRDCPWCAIDAERARRKQHRAASRTGGAEEQVIYRVGTPRRPAVATTPPPNVKTSPAPARRFSSRGVIAAAVLAMVVIGSLIGLAAYSNESEHHSAALSNFPGAQTISGSAGSPTPGSGTGGRPVATFDGYQSLRIGMTQSEATAAMGAAPANHFFHCTVLGDNMPNVLKAWIADSSGRVTGIETPRGVLTDRGVGDGSSAAEIHAAYDGSGYTVDDGYGGGQGMRAINIFEGPKDYSQHRLLSFPIGDNGLSGPPSIGRPTAWEGC